MIESTMLVLLGSGLIIGFMLAQVELLDKRDRVKLHGHQVVFPGETARFTVECAEGNPDRYEWFIGGERMEVGASDTLRLDVDQSMDGTRIDVHAYDSGSVRHLGWDMKTLKIQEDE